VNKRKKLRMEREDTLVGLAETGQVAMVRKKTGGAGCAACVAVRNPGEEHKPSRPP